MRNATLLFLVKKSKNNITDICFAMKKRGFGAGRWNGAGGKVKIGESIETAMIRETAEEIGIMPQVFSKIAELSFTFVSNPDWNQTVHVYFSTRWEGELGESEEMAPKWFRVDDIPFDAMWPDDIYWLPLVIQGKLLHAKFTFGENDIVLEKEVREVAAL